MFWVNPYSQRNQRARLWPVRGPASEAETRVAHARAREAAERDGLQRGIDQVRRELDELRRELAAKRAVWERADEAARIKCDIAWERFVQTYQRYAEQQKAGFDRKWDGQPRDRGRYSFGKKPKLVSQPAAMRRRGPRPPATPAQQVRLAIASARAREAVARVQQLDPNWRAPQSATSRDNSGDYEVMIRAKEAERQEAEARFMALSRARQDAPYAMRDPPTTAEVMAPGGNLRGYQVPGAGAKIRTVSPAEFENMRVELMAGARQIDPTGRYDGVWYRREDGSEFGLRISRDHGLSLEVIRSAHPLIPNGLRFHQR